MSNTIIGENLQLRPLVDIEAIDQGVIEIGDNVFLGKGTTIAAMEYVKIGNDVYMGEYVSIRDHDHKFEDPDILIREQGYKCKPTTIGNDVWLSAKVTVAKGVTIGDGSVVGANSAVTHDIPPYEIWAGVPARFIRKRGAHDDENINYLRLSHSK